MADDWAGLSAQLGKMQQAWYVAARSYWSVFDQNSDTATIVAEDGSTRQVPSWRAISGALGSKANKATTLAGYGITDAIPAAGGTVPGQLSFTNSIAGGSVRQNGDIGAGFGWWRTAPSFLTMLCQQNGAAYTLWRADSYARSLANCMVHARNYDGSAATVQYRVANGADASQGDALFEMMGDGTFTVAGPAGGSNVTLSREGHVLARGLIVPGAYTRATLPAPNGSPSGIAYISDGPNGPTHVFSNGQKWRIPTMTDL
ncbi:hypothetical protein ABH313_21865 [Chromobacterium vaccinii]|uniref:hypothetical protein n=1 Tax=Chromobacterium vaccinii TaxID=1108595 RepID=UPI0032600D63